MTTRIFGAIRGAGSQVRERQPVPTIQDGPFGSTAYAGIFRRGPVGVWLALTAGQPMFERVYGGLTQAGQAPLAAQHFYATARGAGQLHVVRVTDGTEEAASLALYDRNVGRSLLEISPPTRAAQVVTASAHNGGRWGGRRAIQVGDVDLSTAINGATIDLGFATLEDKWIGAVLKFVNDDAAWEGVITANTAAGVFTIAGAFSDDVDGGSDGRFTLQLDNAHELTGELEAVAVEVADGGEHPGTEWSLHAHVDGAQAKSWTDVSMDDGGEDYWHAEIDGDTDNYELAVVDDFTGDPADALQRPANFAEIAAPGGVSADGNQVTLQIVRWSRSGVGNPYVDVINDMTWGSDPRPCTITCTFTAATEFDVAVEFADGETADLAAGDTGVAYESQHAFVPGFTVTAGAVAAEAGTEVVLYVRPLPADLAGKGAWFYPAAAASEGNVRTRYRVVANDHDTITLQSGVDITDEVTEPGAPSHTGTEAGTFDLSSGTNEVIYTVGGRAQVTLEATGSGAATTTADLAADLNAVELADVASAADKRVEFSVSDDDQLVITALQDFGPGAELVIGAGGLNTRLGFTPGTYVGESPTIGRLQWRQELGGGYDGTAGITAGDYSAVWQVGASPFDDLQAENTGLVRYATPGITTAAVQTAMMAYAEANNGAAYVEIPDTITSEAAATKWHEDNLGVGTAQDYAPAAFPSYVKISNPYGRGLYTCTASGLILGLEARKATEAEGYHLAPAGIDYVLTPIAKDLPTGKTVLNNELLNGYGLIELRRRGGKIYVWGDRIAGNARRVWKHERAAISHIGRVLLTNTDALVFRQINDKSLALARKRVQELFRPWYLAGWFDDSDGPDFSDQVEIKADASNNPTTQRQLGNMHVDIGFTIAGTAERVIFSIGPKGVAVL